MQGTGGEVPQGTPGYRMGRLDCLGSILTFYKQIFFADRQYVTPNFDTMQAGRRIFRNFILRGSWLRRAHHDTKAGRRIFYRTKLSHLATSQDWLGRGRARIFQEAAAREKKKLDVRGVGQPGFFA